MTSVQMMKNSFHRQTISNISYLVFAQFAVFALGIIKSVLLPKFWSEESFGYWQLYLFYCAYVSLFALGFSDGIYLRYGKYSYDALPQKRLKTAIRIFTGGLFLCSVITAFCVVWDTDPNRCFVFWGVSVNIVLLCLYGVLIVVMQITNQLKKYSIFSLADKLILLLGILLVIFLDNKNYRVVILIDICAKITVFSCMLWACRSLFWGEGSSFPSAWRELKTDIRIGIKLMIANLMGSFVLGVGRILVEWLGDIKEYAYYSFGISATNLILIFISAVSMVMYPTIKRLPVENYGNYYDKINAGLGFFNFGVLILYFPVCWFIGVYLPHYTVVFSFLNFLFAIIVMQSKISLLNNTFYKTLRLEKEMLQVNIGSVLLFLLIAPIFYWFVRELWVIAFCSLIVMVMRCYSSERFLRRQMNIAGGQYGIELFMLAAFVGLTSWIPSGLAAGCYIVLLAGYGIYNQKTIYGLISGVKKLYS